MRLWYLFFAITFWLISYACHLFYYEIGEGIMHSIINGDFTDYADYPAYTWLAYIGLARIFLWLAAICKGFAFYSVFIAAFQIYGMTLLAAVLHALCIRLQLKRTSRWLLYLTGFALIAAPNIWAVYLTRYSLLLCGSGLLALLIHKRMLWWGTAAFVLGMLIRYESGIAVLLLALLYAATQPTALYRHLHRLKYAMAAAVALVAFLIVDHATTTDFYKQIEPEVEFRLMVQKNLVPLSAMPTTADSAKYMAAAQLMISDPDHITTAFLRSIIDYNTPVTLRHYMQTASRQFTESLVQNTTLVALHLLILAMSILCRRGFWRILIFSVGFMFILFTAAATAKLTPYFVQAYYGFFLILCSAQLAVITAYPQPLIKVAGVMLCTLLIYQCFTQAEVVSQNLHQQKQQIAAHQWLNQNMKGKILVFDLLCTPLFNTQPFQSNALSPSIRPLLHDVGSSSTVPAYAHHLSKVCQCSSTDMAALYKYFISKKDSIVFISNEERIALRQKYLQDARQLSVSTMPYPAPLPQNFFGMGVFRLR